MTKEDLLRYSNDEKRLSVGDWIAQYDETYKDWFYYNVKTQQSTWDKPRDLSHIVFKTSDEREIFTLTLKVRCQQLSNVTLHKQGSQGLMKSQLMLTPSSPVTKYRYITNTPSRLQSHPQYPLQTSHDARNRVFVESSSGQFFGLNTTNFRTEGILGGLYKKLTNYYDNTAQVNIYIFSLSVCLLSFIISQDYLSGVYSDALDDYFGGLVQLIGWFLFGSLMVLVNTGMAIMLINNY